MAINICKLAFPSFRELIHAAILWAVVVSLAMMAMRAPKETVASRALKFAKAHHAIRTMRVPIRVLI